MNTFAARILSVALICFLASSSLASEPGKLSTSPTVMIGVGIGAASINASPSMIYEPTLGITFFDNYNKTPNMGLGIKASVQMMNDGYRGLGVALDGFKDYLGGEIGIILPSKTQPVGVGPIRQIAYQATVFLTWYRVASLYVRQVYTPNWHQPNETDVGVLFMLPARDLGKLLGFATWLGGG